MAVLKISLGSQSGAGISGLVIVVLALAGAPQLMAGYVRVLTAAYDQNTGFNVHDTGQIANLASAESGPFADFGSSFDARAYARFDPFLGPVMGAYSANDNTVPINQGITPAQAWWGVTFTVTGAPGTQVTYNVGLRLNDALSAVAYPNGLGAETFANLDGTGALAGLFVHDTVTSLASNLAPNREIWTSKTYNSGDVVTVGATLYTEADAQGGIAIAAAYSTGLFALQVVTPGGGYTTDNGAVFQNSFASDTPEPAAFGLGAIGCLGLLLASARKSRAASTIIAEQG